MGAIAAEFADYVRALVQTGGPREPHDAEFAGWVRRFDDALQSGLATEGDRLFVLSAFGDAVSLDTVQGMVVQKPHGYAGDFEVIDRIYTSWMSPRQDLVRWDEYFHAQSAPQAVRNRKGYFHQLLLTLRSGASVLNLGSGPGRCIREWFDAHPDSDLHFDCVDVDPTAIEYARFLNAPYSDRITFHERNVLRFRAERRYDLVWAAGLFDYFDDRAFRSVARRAMGAVHQNGSLVIGNFAVGNPSRAYMELGGWRLRHRTAPELAALIAGCEACESSIHVESESEGVNLFVHASPA